MRSFGVRHNVKRPSAPSRPAPSDRHRDLEIDESLPVEECSLSEQQGSELNALRDAYLHLQETVNRLELERNRFKEEIEISHQQNLALKEASEHLKREYEGFRKEFDRYTRENTHKIEAYYRMKKLMNNLVGMHGERVFRPEASEYLERLSRILQKLP